MQTLNLRICKEQAAHILLKQRCYYSIQKYLFLTYIM